MDDDSLDVATFLSLTGVTDERIARHFLNATQGDLNRAVDIYLANADHTLPTARSGSRGGGSSGSSDNEAEFNSVPNDANEHFSGDELDPLAREPAPPVGNNQSWMSYLSSFTSYIPSFFWTALSAVVTFFTSMLPWSGDGLGAGGSRAYDHAAAKMMYEQTFGVIHPEFFGGGISDALRLARASGRPLLFYFHSRTNQDTRRFCSTVMRDQAFIQTVNDQFVFVLCDVAYADCHALSMMARVTAYPSLACGISNEDVDTHAGRGGPDSVSLAIVEPMIGISSLSDVDSIVSRLHSVASLTEARRRERERRAAETVASRSIMAEQDEAYQRSLLMDMQREKAKQEEERSKQEEISKQRQVFERVAQRVRTRQSLPIEPDNIDAVTVRFQFPTDKITRKFSPKASVNELYQFASVWEPGWNGDPDYAYNGDGAPVFLDNFTLLIPASAGSLDFVELSNSSVSLEDAGIKGRTVVRIKQL